jgi:hypothetical protein
MGPLDIVVIGSDEVWNLRHPWYAGCPAFWGEGLNAPRVVTYAASFGNYSCWDGIGSPWTEILHRIDAISVRDENSYWMLKNALGIEVPTVLDPALQFPLSPEGAWDGPRHPYALVYGHNFSPGYARQVRRWADAHELPLLSVGYRNDWADIQWLDAGPHDFAHAASRATAVATNFFHGCVFALRNHKPFACERTAYRSIKVGGLMELLGAEDHLVTEDATDDRLDRLLCAPIDPAILKRLAQLRQLSNDYLDGALQEDDVSEAA